MKSVDAINILIHKYDGNGWQFDCARCAGNCDNCALGLAFNRAIKALEETED